LTLDTPPANAGVMPDSVPDAAITDLTFEAALKRLEEIVRKLETGDTPLDVAIDLYAEGDRLKQQCEKRLADAQARIEKIQLGRDGTPAGTVPFGDG
jgi:exodeoxyribonuclease VII small subunit